tara:strand:+ start:124 stop:780 length:657 start_codon:yes stop_codon:yes gene_type:complete
MKTVRLSEQLKRDIKRAAEKKYDNANPQKDYPKDGMQLFIDEGYQQKIDLTSQQFKDVWGYEMPTNAVNELQISSTVVTEDEDGDEYQNDKSFILQLPDVIVPKVLVQYGDRMRVKVKPDNPTFLQCVEIEMFNDNLYTKKRDYLENIRGVLNRFSTLNQLMKAAPYMKDLVPQERIQKMHEKDDRTGRRQEQAEIADTELAELREVLLEDALLGDDS